MHLGTTMGRKVSARDPVGEEEVDTEGVRGDIGKEARQAARC